MSFPRQHRTKLHSTNPIERLNKEVKRRADVVGIFPNEASIMRLIGAVLFEQNDEWQTSSRYMMVEAFAQIDKEEIDPILSITTKSRLIMTSGHPEKLHQLDGRDPSSGAYDRLSGAVQWPEGARRKGRGTGGKCAFSYIGVGRSHFCAKTKSTPSARLMGDQRGTMPETQMAGRTARHASPEEKFFALKVLVNGWPLISKRLSLRHPAFLSHIQLRLASFFSERVHCCD